MRSNADLAEVVAAYGGSAGLLRPDESGEQQAGEDRDNRDHYQQLDEGEPGVSS